MTPPIFLGHTLLFVIFNYYENWFLGIGKIDTCSIILQINGLWFRHYRSHCICPSGNPYCGTRPVLSTTVPIFVSLEEKLEKFSGLNFKR